MKLEKLTTVSSVRYKIRALKAEGKTVGFVPTMGALHDGHLSLIRRAKAENDVAAISVFVNPTQFNDRKDFEAYPQDLAADLALAADAGAEIAFAPAPAEIYPEGFVSKVIVDGPLTRLLEGYYRPGHFEGVTTVVAKLFHIVQPDRAYFGEKDWQQLKVVERMTRDLDLPLEIVPCPTSREADGVARSSRNARLSPEARVQARVIPYLLDTAQDLLDSAGPETQTDRGPVLRQWLLTLLESNQPAAAMEYIAVVDPETLTDIDEITDRALVTLAIRIGGVRLIDNRIIVRR